MTHPTPYHELASTFERASELMRVDGFVDGHRGVEPDGIEHGTVPVYLNGDVVDTLLESAGWEQTSHRGYWTGPVGGPWVGRDEALTLTLTARAVAWQERTS